MFSFQTYTVGSVLLIFLVFCVVLLFVFAFLIQCCDVRYFFALKRCLVFLDPQLFVGGLVSYLRYIFVVVCVKVVSNTYGVVLFGLVVFVLWIVYGGVQHIDVFVCCFVCLHWIWYCFDNYFTYFVLVLL